jgi:hypothetical protein
LNSDRSSVGVKPWRSPGTAGRAGNHQHADGDDDQWCDVDHRSTPCSCGRSAGRTGSPSSRSAAAVPHLMKRELSIGVSVNDTSSDTPTANAAVRRRRT